MSEPLLWIGGVPRAKSSDSHVFEVDVSELGDLRLDDIPGASTVEIGGLPGSLDERFYLSMTITHAFSDASRRMEFFLSVHVGFLYTALADEDATWRGISRRLRLASDVCDPVSARLGLERDEGGMRIRIGDAWHAQYLYSRNFTRDDSAVISDLVQPWVAAGETLLRMPEVRAFLCHASEDKAFVDELAKKLDHAGIDIWYDKREIRPGDSIVERVGEGLTEATHLVVTLSPASIDKPWVKRELSSTLMRQLASENVKIVPVVAERCPIPVLLADIRYVDCTLDRTKGFEELINSFR